MMTPLALPEQQNRAADQGPRIQRLPGPKIPVDMTPRVMDIAAFLDLKTHKFPKGWKHHGVPPDKQYERYPRLETHLWRVHGWILCDVKHHPGDCQPNGNNGDGDMTFEVSEAKGGRASEATHQNTIHCEIPKHVCTAGSQWQADMVLARATMRAELQKHGCATGVACRKPLKLFVFGVGLSDRVAHRDDVWPELHPVLGANESGAWGLPDAGAGG